MTLLNRVRGAAAALLLAFAAVPAHAADPAGLAGWFEAADAFDRLAAASTREPPRLSDPAAAPVLARLTDPAATFGDRRFAVAEIQQLAQLVIRSGGIATVYIEFGLTPGASETERAVRGDRNVIAFQDELVPLLGMMVDSMGSLMVSISTDPQARDGNFNAAGMRSSLEETLRGYIQLMGIEQISAQNKLAMSTRVAANASTLVPVLSLSQRAGLSMQARMVRPRLGPQTQAQLDRLIEALGSRSCEFLCAR
jgi:hypothetical protein